MSFCVALCTSKNINSYNVPATKKRPLEHKAIGRRKMVMKKENEK